MCVCVQVGAGVAVCARWACAMSAGPPPLLFYGPPRRIPFFALVFLLLALVAAATTVQDGFQIISKQNGSLVAAAAAQGLGPSDNITATSTTPRSDNIDKESWTLAKPLLNETTTSTPAPKWEIILLFCQFFW